MKKLFYFLFLTPFFMISCSDDDKDFFTRDIEYEVYARVVETTYPTLQNKIYITVGGEGCYIEGYSCKPKLSYVVSSGTLHIHCGELEYTKYTPGGCFDGYPELHDMSRTSVPPGDYDVAYEPQIDFPSDITKIIITRKGAQDTYSIDMSDNMITISPQQSSFSRFVDYKYYTRAKNTFVVVFSQSANTDTDLYDEFFKFVSATIPLTIYEYDPDIESTWWAMRYRRDMPIYQYENADDLKKIIRLFDEYCDGVAKNTQYFYAHFEDWTGKYYDYPIY